MAAGGGSMMAASFIQAGAQAGGAISEAAAKRAQGNYESSQASLNAKMADLQAEDATKRGERLAEDKGKEAQALLGSQKAAAAANGVDVGSGSSADIQADTLKMSSLDQMTIRNNAAREAMGYKVQSSNYTSQGAMAKIAGDASARNTIMTGGMNALSTMGKGYADKRRAIDGTLNPGEKGKASTGFGSGNK